MDSDVLFLNARSGRLDVIPILAVQFDRSLKLNKQEFPCFLSVNTHQLLFFDIGTLSMDDGLPAISYRTSLRVYTKIYTLLAANEAVKRKSVLGQ